MKKKIKSDIYIYNMFKTISFYTVKKHTFWSKLKRTNLKLKQTEKRSHILAKRLKSPKSLL